MTKLTLPVTTERDDKMTYHSRARRPGTYLVPALALFVAAGCDTDVTNPGPVQDQFLDSLNAHAAVVKGASRNFSNALAQIAYWGGALTYEINPAGSTGSFGIPSSVQDGRLELNFSGDWNRAQLARWAAENAVERFQRALADIPGAPAFASYGPAAEASLLAGYANRLIGENFCQVVFDGGGPESFTVGLTRAEAAFSQANTIATGSGDDAIATAALAGRASVRADLASYGLASWSDAANDAAAVTSNTFAHTANYSVQDQDQGNFIMVASPGLGTYRAHTTWGTFYEDYFRTTGDARVPWTQDPAIEFGDAAVSKFGGNVIFMPQAKYDKQNSPITLSSGWEMRLIQAEAALQAAGGAAAAVGFMNVRRADLGLTALTVTTDAQAYTDLKLERALELWLEGRRMFDLRRWGDNGLTGATVSTCPECIGDVRDGIYGTGTANVAGIGDETALGVLDTQLTTIATNAKCWPIGRSEVETNTGVTR